MSKYNIKLTLLALLMGTAVATDGVDEPLKAENLTEENEEPENNEENYETEPPNYARDALGFGAGVILTCAILYKAPPPTDTLKAGAKWRRYSILGLNLAFLERKFAIESF